MLLDLFLPNTPSYWICGFVSWLIYKIKRDLYRIAYESNNIYKPPDDQWFGRMLLVLLLGGYNMFFILYLFYVLVIPDILAYCFPLSAYIRKGHPYYQQLMVHRERVFGN